MFSVWCNDPVLRLRGCWWQILLLVAVAVVIKLEVNLDEGEVRKLVFNGSIWLRGCW